MTKIFVIVMLFIAGHSAFVSYAGAPQDPPPPPNNSSGTSNMAPQGGVSGGGGSGVESNGTLATHIAKRNFNRLKSDNSIDYNDKEVLPLVSAVKQYNLSLRDFNNTDLINFIPEESSHNTIAHITSPIDLLGITNAKEIFAADYFNQYGRMAAILATTTENEIYEHTKVICDRKFGARLDDISYISVNGHTFILSKIIHRNGVVEYASGFTAYVGNGNFEIDNQWTIDEFETRALNFNFQVWSNSIGMTQSLMEDIIALMSEAGAITYNNSSDPPIPDVFVESGYYSAGELHLNIKNTVGANTLSLDGSQAVTETAQREDVIFNTPLNGQLSQSITVNTTGLFDIGVYVNNNVSPTTDLVYFSDGTWGTDYDDAGAILNYFEVFEETDFIAGQNEFVFERDAIIEGKVKDYVSLYREAPVGNENTDFSQFNALRFNAYGHDQEVIITLVDPAIDVWADQFRCTVVTNPVMSSFTVPFSTFSSLSGIPLDASNIVTVVFSIVGDGNIYIDFSLSVSDLKYINTNAFSIDEMNGEELKSFPNPFRDYTKVYFVLDQEEIVDIRVIDLTGKTVISESISFASGLQSYTFHRGTLNKGLYFFELINSKGSSITKLVIQ